MTQQTKTLAIRYIHNEDHFINDLLDRCLTFFLWFYPYLGQISQLFLSLIVIDLSNHQWKDILRKYFFLGHGFDVFVIQVHLPVQLKWICWKGSGGGIWKGLNLLQRSARTYTCLPVSVSFQPKFLECRMWRDRSVKIPRSKTKYRQSHILLISN